MLKITFGEKVIDCNVGDNLRKVLLENDVPLYNGNARIINCMGIGSCGTCAVEITGNIADRNWKEQARLSFPPHKLDRQRRLACQVQVTDDLIVKKYDGFWGQGDRLNS
ncbi:MAG: (2Fe-2S)-binding protein [Limnothrix sp. RL_2_0]|nr:(2Fe-2S)-binding protein [Limnothrix sp. RL_2_0]